MKRAIELRNIVTSLGPAYIKLGQVGQKGGNYATERGQAGAR